VTFVADTSHLLARQLRVTLRMPWLIAINLVQPLIWLLLFGQLFHAVAGLSGFGTGSYIRFLAPGVVVMSALFGAAYSGLGVIADLDAGLIDRLLSTPASRLAAVLSRVLQTCVTGAVQSVVMLGLALVLGAGLPGGLAGFLMPIGAGALLGAAVWASSTGMALVARRQEALLGLINFVALPLTFLSSILTAPALMPGWMRAISAFNPIDWSVTVARYGFEGARFELYGLQLGLLTVLAVTCTWLAAVALRGYARSL
jgi:ABC-2 type transport system permease protein